MKPIDLVYVIATALDLVEFGARRAQRLIEA